MWSQVQTLTLRLFVGQENLKRMLQLKKERDDWLKEQQKKALANAFFLQESGCVVKSETIRRETTHSIPILWLAISCSCILFKFFAIPVLWFLYYFAIPSHVLSNSAGKKLVQADKKREQTREAAAGRSWQLSSLSTGLCVETSIQYL